MDVRSLLRALNSCLGSLRQEVNQRPIASLSQLQVSVSGDLFLNKLFLISLTVGLNFMAFVCMWGMWIMAYMHQMYQIQKPQVTDLERFERLNAGGQ